MKSVLNDPMDIGGYFIADSEKIKAVTRPSEMFNATLKEYQLV